MWLFFIRVYHTDALSLPHAVEIVFTFCRKRNSVLSGLAGKRIPVSAFHRVCTSDDCATSDQF